MRKIILTTLLLLFIIPNSQAQKMARKVSAFKNLINKEKVIVKLYDKEAKRIVNLKKEIEKTKKEKKKNSLIEELEEQYEFIDYYNKMIKEVITPENWKFNKEIIFMSEIEFDKLYKEKKLDDYALLDFVLGRYSKLDFKSHTRGNEVTFPTIIYTNASNKKMSTGTYLKAVYQNFFFNTNYNFEYGKSNDKKEKYIDELLEEKNVDRIFSPENILVSINMVQRHINSIIENNKVTKFKNFAIKEAIKNCSASSGKELLIQKAVIHNKIIDNPQQFYTKGSLKLVSAKRIAEAVLNNEDVLIGFPFIEGIITGKGPHPIAIALYYKIGINPKDYSIVSFIDVRGFTNHMEIIKKDLEKMSNCKF